MSNVSRKVLMVLSVSLLAGCAAHDPYMFSKDEKQASLKLLSAGGVSMCKTGKLYKLAMPDGAQAAPIPVGGRVDFVSSMFFGDGHYSYTCFPAISFVPKESETYVLHGLVRNGRCFLEIVREDQSKETGLAFEPSIGPRTCYTR
jgi:hypothetical protein